MAAPSSMQRLPDLPAARIHRLKGSEAEPPSPMEHTSAEPSEEHLVERIRSGDVEAFERLFRRYYDELYGFAWRYVPAHDLAEDLVQGVFVRIWLRRAEWRPRRVKTYLYGAVRNEALQYLEHERVVRRSRPEVVRRGETLVPSPEAEMIRSELAGRIEQAIERLPERRRLIFVMHRQHELTYGEIAAVLGISAHTVETQIRRALATLRKLLALIAIGMVFLA